MKISVRVKTKAKEPRVEKIGDFEYKVFVKELPEKGKANEAVVKLLSDFFQLPKSNIQIIKGFEAKAKIVEISDI